MPELTYFGHSAFQIKSGSVNILVDPFISGNPLATVSKEDLKPDYIIITHGHDDHVGDALEISTSTGAPIISNFEIASYFSSLGAKTEAMHIGGSRKFPFGKVKLTIAHHGSGLSGPDGKIIYLGNPCGVIISIDGKNIYHAGDTGLFLDMKLIGELTSIDVALLPIGDNFTMGVEDAVKAAEFLQARVNVPMHYNTFDLIKTDPKSFVEGVKALNLDAVIIEPGGSLEI